MLHVSINYDKDFCDLYTSFGTTEKKKKLLQLSGISRDELDFSDMSKRFFRSITSDISVDPNANVGQSKSFNTYTNEIFKGLMKLNGLYLLWMYLKKLFNVETANRIISKCISGFYYPHDLTKWVIPYCIGASTYHLIVEGRRFGDLFSRPPKRTDSYVSQIVETTMDLSQNFAGAVALADLFVNYSWFLVNDLIEEHHLPKQAIAGFVRENSQIRSKIRNEFQRFVHTVNNKFRVGGDSLRYCEKIRVYRVKSSKRVTALELCSDFSNQKTGA